MSELSSTYKDVFLVASRVISTSILRDWWKTLSEEVGKIVMDGQRVLSVHGTMTVLPNRGERDRGHEGERVDDGDREGYDYDIGEIMSQTCIAIRYIYKREEEDRNKQSLQEGNRRIGNRRGNHGQKGMRKVGGVSNYNKTKKAGKNGEVEKELGQSCEIPGTGRDHTAEEVCCYVLLLVEAIILTPSLFGISICLFLN